VEDIRRILCPMDMSDLSRQAARYAMAFAQQQDGELHMLYVLEDALAKLPSSIFPAPGAEDAIPSSGVLAELATVLDREVPSGLKLIRSTRQGFAGEEVVRYARQHGIDLIVMGTHGRSGLAHALLGSVSQEVMRKAPCPVLTLRA